MVRFGFGLMVVIFPTAAEQTVACRELILTYTDPPIYDSENGEFKTPEEVRQPLSEFFS